MDNLSEDKKYQLILEALAFKWFGTSDQITREAFLQDLRLVTGTVMLAMISDTELSTLRKKV